MNPTALSDNIKAWGRIEAALAATQAELGIIPAEAAATIEQATLGNLVDVPKFLAEQEDIGHPLIPYLHQLEHACGEHGHWVHYGATTDNILNTGVSLQVSEALAYIHHQQSELLLSMASLAETHAHTVMPGRTQSQQALPFTFGCKVAGWLDEFCRHIPRQKAAEANGLRVLFGGAIGSGAAFGEHAEAILLGVSKRLGLPAMPLPLRSISDGWCELAQVYTLSAGTLAKMATDLKTLGRTEIGEVFQDDGSVGSSTMPQKRNPVHHHALLQAHNTMLATQNTMLQARITADDGDSLCAKQLRDGLTAIIDHYAQCLASARSLVDTLVVNTERMRSNLDLDGGWIMAEPVMFALCQRLNKTEAHDILHDVAMSAKSTGISLRQALEQHPQIAGLALSPEAINELLNPLNYLGRCEAMTKETVSRIRRVLKSDEP